VQDWDAHQVGFKRGRRTRQCWKCTEQPSMPGEF